MHPYLAELGHRVLVFDGAMGTMLAARELGPEAYGGMPFYGCNEALVLQRPDVIEAVHAAYLTAGADVLETATFGASSLKLAEYGLAHRAAEINHAAAAAARAALARVPAARPRFIAGAMGPTGMLLSSSDPALSRITFGELAAVYAEQAAALVGGGADLLLLETAQDLEEVRAAVAGIVGAFDAGLRRVPIQAQVSLDVTGRMLLGPDIRTVCSALDALPIDVIGVNCSTGTQHMRDAARYLCATSRCYVAVVPNAGLPKIGPNGETVFPETPEDMATALRGFVADFGVNAVGGCCGTTPEHIAALARAVAGLHGQMPHAHPETAVAHIAPARRQRNAAARASHHGALGAFRLGVRTIDAVDPLDLWATLDLNDLYRAAWGGSNVKGAQWRALVRDEFEPRLRRLQASCERTGLLEARAVYGAFPAAADGAGLVLYSPSDTATEIARFTVAGRPPERGLWDAERDVVAVQAVTLGPYAAERVAALQQRGEYSESYFLAGFVACVTDALAELLQRRIRAELGFAGAGVRYAWGSHTLPDRAQLATVWELLDAERAIGATLTPELQIVPEQSAAALIVRTPPLASKPLMREVHIA